MSLAHSAIQCLAELWWIDEDARRERLLMTIFPVYHGYMDESGTHDESEIVAVAGYLGTFEGWGRFETQWNSVMNHYCVKDFHMTDFEAHQAEFRDNNYWTPEIRTNLIVRLTAICRENTIMGIGCAVVRAEYESCLPKGIQDDLRHPYYFCLYGCLYMLINTNLDHRISPIRPINFLFDQKKGKLKFGSAKIGWEAFATELYTRIRAGLDEDGAILGSMTFGKRQEYPQLRAADLLVFETAKFGYWTWKDPDRQQRKSMTELSKRQNMMLTFPDERAIRNFVITIEMWNDGATPEEIRATLRKANPDMPKA